MRLGKGQIFVIYQIYRKKYQFSDDYARIQFIGGIFRDRLISI